MFLNFKVKKEPLKFFALMVKTVKEEEEISIGLWRVKMMLLWLLKMMIQC